MVIYYFRRVPTYSIYKVREPRMTKLGLTTLFILQTYSVTQSFANSFGGDVVLDTFNNVSRDEDNILDQICKK